MGFSLSSLNPTKWSIGGVSVSDVINNPLLNPVGVIGSIPVTKATALSGIGGKDGLSYDDQLLIGGAVGTGVAAVGAAPAIALPGASALPAVPALSGLDLQKLYDNLKPAAAAPAAPVIVNSGASGGNSQAAIYAGLGLLAFMILKGKR